MPQRSVLMIAFHFPPLAGSSGIQRTLRNVQHLPSLGWQPLVLSAHPRAYERTSPDLDADVPAGTVVRRAFALDTARHLALSGRYAGWMARPDRWVSWRFDAVRQGLKLIREHRPQVIWSTYPIATAHLVGLALHRQTQLPWIADFRDPMAQEGYPADLQTWKRFDAIEREAIANARFSTFTTAGAARLYQQRYPDCEHRIAVLENGYDEASFADAQALLGKVAPPLHTQGLTLLHSGIVYPEERDPTQLMQALRKLANQGVVRPGDFRIRFRASMAEDLLTRLSVQYGVEPFVELCAPLPYREALAEMMRADALLVMQASNCNQQVPAKVYEYLRAQRPVLCLSDRAGDTWGVLRDSGLDAFARLDDADDIADLLARYMQEPGTFAKPGSEAVCAASRAGRAQTLASLLSQAAS
jgi:hypothetical protein